NVLRTIDAVKTILPELRRNIPSSIDISIAKDRTQTIRASVRDVEVTLGITVVLVVAVIFLFLRNVRATIISSAVIPISLMATAAVMLPAGLSLDNRRHIVLSI